MPTFCKADKKPASSPVASSGSAYAGAATAITIPTPTVASSTLITRPFFLLLRLCQLSCCGQALNRLNHVVPQPDCESGGTTFALLLDRWTAWTPGFVASCSSRLSRPSWSTVWCCTLSGFADICATKRFSCSGDWLPLRSLSGVRRRTPLLATTVGAPAPVALPSVPAAGIELNMLPSAIAAGDTASGPPADRAAASGSTAGVAGAPLGG